MHRPWWLLSIEAAFIPIRYRHWPPAPLNGSPLKIVSVALQRVWPSNALEQGPDSDALVRGSMNTEIRLRPSLASAANRRTFAEMRLLVRLPASCCVRVGTVR